MTRRAILTLLAVAMLNVTVGAAPALGAFGFKEGAEVSFNGLDGAVATQAGSHPFSFTTFFELNTNPVGTDGEIPDEELKDLEVDLPPGLAATPTPVPRCSPADFTNISLATPFSTCPNSTAVGVLELKLGEGAITPEVNAWQDPTPVFNLTPPPGTAARLGFITNIGLVPVTIDSSINPNPPYNVRARVTNAPQVQEIYGSRLTLWGTPADPAHDSERGQCAAFSSIPSCPANLPQTPFFTLPRKCAGPLVTRFEGRSWQTVGRWASRDVVTPPGMSGCERLGFSPEVDAQPTTRSAESATGLAFNLDVDDEGITSATGIAQSDIKRAEVVLPEGMAVNPSQAEGLGVCTEADLARETATSEPGEGCPNSSKIGTLEDENPLLEGEIIKGSIFVAKPYENLADDSLIALYIVLKDPKLGVIFKQPAKVIPDPRTGRLVTITEDMPQWPLGHLRLRFREGPRSPLVNPPGCGSYTTKARFTPYGNPGNIYETTSTFSITSGINGGPCPAGGRPFHPTFLAGSLNNSAGEYSPFQMRITRQDGEQDISRFSSILPPGVTGKLAGLARCPQAAVEGAKASSGLAELARPSCPAGSRIGTIVSGAGVGEELTYVSGSLYLGGPYHGDPLSVIAIVPAVAGPFDIGTVVVQEALTLNPDTAEVEVDGSSSDPIPHILQGIPLKVRDLRVHVDRPNFTLNPTSCNPLSASATIGGVNVFNTGDTASAALHSRYQAAGCARLGFKPRLSLRLKGGTRRGSHPALRAEFRPRPGDANASKMVVTMPHSAFLEQAHIRTVCTRVQFAASQCPKGSIYGRARAFTPLLDEPLEGPVYLRSSSHPLPDLVLALRGIVDINSVIRIDSVHARIRASIDYIPDAPLTKVVLNMQGGRKGLIVNSRNLCTHASRAKVRLTGQNGKRRNLSSLVKPTKCGKTKKHQGHKRRR